VNIRKRREGGALTKQQLEELLEVRYRLRRFLHLSEKIAQAEGITPLQ
jgi:hypothetical protein